MKSINRLIIFLAAAFLMALSSFVHAESGSDDSWPTGELLGKGPIIGSVTGAGGTNEGGSQGVQIDEFTGAATYSIPIAVPPGRGGIEPKISLNYNSYRKNPNSWVGYGWELELGSIVRIPDQGNVDYTDGQKFEYRLGGQAETLVLLVESVNLGQYGLSGFGGAKGDVYSAKIDTARNIYIHIKDGSTDHGWCIIDKGGRKYFLGGSKESRDQKYVDGATWIAAWLIDKVVDPNGNEMTVQYESVLTIGEQDIPRLLPDSISYNDIKIEFNKSELDDPSVRYFPNYRQGFLNRYQIKRLEDITVSKKTGIGTWSRLQKVVFEYKNSKRNAVPLLIGLTKLGSSDSEALPPVAINYFEGEDLSLGAGWETNASYAGYEGHLTDINRAFVDMNGDGLADQVIGNPDSMYITVRFNTYKGFSSEKNWTDPLGGVPGIRGRLNVEDGEHRHVFLMDMNGDALPDRVMRTYKNNSNQPSDAYFAVAFNTGSGFKQSLTTWKDPYTGDWAGTIGPDTGLIDMNGDGLVDRIAGTANGFNVWYNTGAGFKMTPVFWKDPMSAGSSDNPAIGKIRVYKDNRLYVDIRDINGDGLPDRINGSNIYTTDNNGNSSVNTGLSVRLNLNGKSWAQPKVNPCPGNPEVTCTQYDSNEVLGIIDPATQGSGGGFISDSTHDLIDMNGDGYLDRIAGFPSAKKFQIYFYKGIAFGSEEHHFSTSPIDLPDPVVDEGEDVVANGYTYNDHSAFIDINGDGYPDRVSLTKALKYKFYPLLFDALAYSDNLMVFDNYPKMSQPSNGLKNLDNGQGFKTATEYFSSSYPLDFTDPTHAFLPTNLFLVHKLYRQDPTVPIDFSVEANRHPNMRWVTYWYHGGNIFVRYAQKKNGDPNDSSLSEEYVSRFSGFQRVQKLYAPMNGETWQAHGETMKFHQALSDVTIAHENKFPYFDSLGYSHFALTGKMYAREVNEGQAVRQKEDLKWDVNGGPKNSLYTNIDCTSPACTVKLLEKKSESWEPPSQISVTTRTEYTYDIYLNVIKQDYFANSTLKSSTLSEYTPYAQFGTLHIRDRLKEETLTLNGNIYREKAFYYDAKGNPKKDIFYTSEGQGEQVLREFDANGNIVNIIGSDGVEKILAYDGDGLFPIKETIALPNGGKVEAKREYYRLTGRVTEEKNQHNVGTRTDYDAFGRPISEHLLKSGGGEVEIGKYEYEYVDVNVDGIKTRVLKTQHFVLQPNFAETMFNLPREIAYTDGTGLALQRCVLSEQKNYRAVYARSYDAGRRLKKTEPVFTGNCDFAATLPQTMPFTQITRDMLRRPTKITPPEGDADSPTGQITIAYKNEFGEHVKDITLPKNQKRLESYDTQGRLTKVVGGINDTVYYDYNPAGDLTKTTSGGKELLKTTYDWLGRKVASVDADMGTWTYAYDKFGHLIQQVDALGQKTSISYDDIGRITKKLHYLSNGLFDRLENYTYDAGEAGWDVKAGELYSVSESDSTGTTLRSSRFSYDPDFRRMAKMGRNTTGLGEFTQMFAHNTIGQVTSTSYNDKAQLFYTYNIIGGLNQVCDNGACKAGAGEIYYEVDPYTGYNEFGSLLEEKYGNGVKGTYEYYPKSHRMSKKVTALDANKYSDRKYTYDAQANITSLLDQAGSLGAVSIKTAKYDNANRLTQTELTGAPAIKMEYDALGNTLKNSTVYGDKTYIYGSSRPHAVTQIHDEQFSYDANGNMLSDAYRTMSYDTLNQLAKVVMKNGSVVEYGYDYAGTRVFKKVSTNDTYGKAVENTTHYLGNAIEIRPSSDEMILHVYAEGKLVATRYIGKASDVFGAPAGMTGWPWSLRPSASFLAEGRGAAVAIPYIQVALLLGILVAMFPRGSVIPAKAGISRAPIIARRQRRRGNLPLAPALRLASLCLVAIIIIHPTLALAGDAGIPLKPVSDVDYLVYHHGDHLGSTHLITEGKKLGRHAGISFPRGSVVQRFEYLPWGQEAFALNPNLTFDPRFTGQEYDIETGLYFYKARYYNPALGRFIQPDSLVQDISDPQSWNRYAYVRNNPLKYTDPSGHYIDYSGGDPNTNDPADTRDDPVDCGPDVPPTAENTVKRETTPEGQPNTNGGLAGNTTNADSNANLGAVNNNVPTNDVNNPAVTKTEEQPSDSGAATPPTEEGGVTPSQAADLVGGIAEVTGAAAPSAKPAAGAVSGVMTVASIVLFEGSEAQVTGLSAGTIVGAVVGGLIVAGVGIVGAPAAVMVIGMSAVFGEAGLQIGNAIDRRPDKTK